MDVISTLGELSTRFTKEEQFTKLEKHANTLKNEWKMPLLELCKANRKVLEWDKARLPEVNRFLGNSAGAKTISLVLVLLVVAKSIFF